ncbi:MAG: hypothetical protein CVU84_05050 [Firmicutes bacterium HGW-Firmicutes-1]|jgi:phosphate transport system substrate-binding protein|nr:MAG: hypothetical protein CVU84_05050 [Firmicutes bacterium HGW-Firmicutes-1]
MKKMKSLLGLLLAATMVLTFVGCGKDVETKTPEETPEAITETPSETTISGEVAISGSTSVEKIGNATGEEFIAINPEAGFSYEAIGSSAGVKNAHEGVTPIGASSRNLKEEEKTWGLTEVVVAYDGIAVVTHPDNAVKALTMEQITAIYKGEITNWSEVGGADQVIVVVSREDGSGTRGAFEELLEFEKELTANAMIAEGNGNVQTSVAGNPQAIGYVSLTSIDETVKAVSVNDVEATVENVLAETYKISRPFLMIYHEENMTTATQAYMDFILSEEGQVIVTESGGIPVK